MEKNIKKASSSNCHTFYIIYYKHDNRFINQIFIRESEAKKHCERFYWMNYGYMKVEMPIDLKEDKGEAIITRIL